MKFTSTRTIENIHLIYQLIIKESKTAGDIALDMCCGKPMIYLYLKHMEAEGLIKEDGRLGNIHLYKAIMGVSLPPLVEPVKLSEVEVDQEAIDKRKLKAKFSKIVPFRDPWLFVFKVK